MHSFLVHSRAFNTSVLSFFFFFCSRKIASALVGLWDTSCFSVVFSAKEVVNNLGTRQS